MFRSHRIFRSFISLALFAGLGVSVLTIRLYIDGKHQYESARDAQQQSDSWQKVVMVYENSVKTYFPGNPYPQRALWELSILARSAQMRGDFHQARYIWEVVRRSAVSQRNFHQPFIKYISDARRNLSKLQGTETSRGTRNMRGRVGAVANDGLEDPPVAGVVILWLGLSIWIVGALLAIWQENGKKRLVCWTVSLAGTMIWILTAFIV